MLQFSIKHKIKNCTFIAVHRGPGKSCRAGCSHHFLSWRLSCGHPMNQSLQSQAKGQSKSRYSPSKPQKALCCKHKTPNSSTCLQSPVLPTAQPHWPSSRPLSPQSLRAGVEMTFFHPPGRLLETLLVAHRQRGSSDTRASCPLLLSPRESSAPFTAPPPPDGQLGHRGVPSLTHLCL